MSWFAYGTFKQDVLDDIELCMERYSLSRLSALPDLLEVLSHIASTAPLRDEAVQKARADALAQARSELITKISS